MTLFGYHGPTLTFLKMGLGAENLHIPSTLVSGKEYLAWDYPAGVIREVWMGNLVQNK